MVLLLCLSQPARLPSWPGEGEEKYLIATSEQTLCAMHRKGWFEKNEVRACAWLQSSWSRVMRAGGRRGSRADAPGLAANRCWRRCHPGSHPLAKPPWPTSVGGGPPPPPSSNLQLPIKYVGYSTCFRKEAGSHGRDTLGIFRWVGRAAKGMCMCGFLGEVGLRREGIGTGQLMAGAGEATVALAERPCCHSGCNVMREKAGTPHPYVVA
jgi:hypothetical protein